ncbi:TSC22 domain family protein 3 isoform X2 [Thalassophryne amazonica]|uniref:TSC22 domain family protein 3 isoform X2 n=1 Tax=Thalassophryne amazonica TaxID=390379 RepID=UPI0014721F16|nr:TSC22 domain family protein 3 isoform X2 [Thalassophryne amazonica]
MLLVEHSLHLEAKMGQRQTRPAKVVRSGSKLPSPRTLCAFHLAESAQRSCCHYHHFNYPERAMGYSPPYSPSLFMRPERRASGASVVAIDNKIEQAMDLVKNHLMYAVREEVEILKEQIKELAEKNNQLERENYLLKNLASPEQLEKFQSRTRQTCCCLWTISQTSCPTSTTSRPATSALALLYKWLCLGAGRATAVSRKWTSILTSVLKSSLPRLL